MRREAAQAAALKLRSWRKRNGLTQVEAAEHFGVSERSWRRYETPEYGPPRWLVTATAGKDRRLTPAR